MTASDTFVEAQTTAGKVRGRQQNECAVFLGIPFAQPPVGDLRFAEPRPMEPWDGVRDALEMGATPQRGGDGSVTLIPEPSVPGESTLNVNVFTPVADTSRSLPVLVYIHGGGFFSGSPASTWYDGTSFAKNGVVTVVLSYRLGFEGFGFVAGAPHNRGVLDWLAALTWVRDNIANFGGDPHQVTIAGQSAGGGAVLTLLGMESAQVLFHRVYCISGATADVSRARAQEFSDRMAATAGIAPNRTGFESVPELQLLEVQNKVLMPKGNPLKGLQSMIKEGLALGPMVDGELIKRPTLDSIALGVGANKPLVIGSTDDEFTMAFIPMRNKMKWIPAGLLLGVMGLRGEKKKTYLADNADVAAKGTAFIAGRYLTDQMFRTTIPKVIAARGQAPTWAYRFAWASPVHLSAPHCLDVPFFFNVLDAERVTDIAGDNPPQSIADEVHLGAVRFIASGAPTWEQYGDNGTTRVFDTPTETVTQGFASVRSL